MPADLNGGEPILRLYSRGQKLGYKRAKGEASCAECRRLKLKCDRKAPCTSCIRRGCQIICPNGSLTAGQGSRFVLANTDKLHDKLLEMSKRIRQLEDALQISHASITPTSHPLLSEELLAIKSGVDIAIEKDDSDDDTDGLASGLCSELGTLSISERGDACFMGRCSSEALLMAIDEALVDHPGQEKYSINFSSSLNVLPQQIKAISEAFPFSFDDLPKSATLQMIEALLPSYGRATALAEAYLSNIAWSYRLVDREQIFEDLLPSAYKRPKGDIGRYDDKNEGDYVHQLALLLSIFATGASGDLTLPIGNDEAELYNHLARAALSLKSVFVGASMETVQTVLMLAASDFSSCRKYSLEPSWKLMAFGLSLTSSIGLHRDPARWNMEPRLAQRRRRLFWEAFYIDKWKSLESGRPATFNLREIDCEFPEDKEATLDEHGSMIPSFWHWKYRFTKEVVAPIAEQLCQARALKYPEILELDRKIREFEPHPSLLMSKEPETDEDMTTAMRRYHWAALREVALLLVHRSFFARAMLESPTRPLGSPFVSSLLSAYASARTLLNVIRVYYGIYPYMLLRQWVVWAHGLTSAVIVGCVACRGPASHTAAAALKELEAAVELYKEAQIHPVPRRALPFLLRLLDKARSANQTTPKDTGNARQELTILGGAPIFLNKAARKSSTLCGETSPIRHQPGRFIDEQHSVDMISAPVVSISRHPSAVHQQSNAPASTAYASFQQPPSISSGSDEPFCNNLSDFWPNYSMDSASRVLPPSISSDSQEHQSTSRHVRNTRDLSSTSWLEELSSILPVGLGQNNANGTNAANLDFLIGRGDEITCESTGFTRPERGDDPVIAEAWRFLLTGSQAIGTLHQ